MAHDVRFRVPARPLGNADIEFVVDRDGERFGTLHISKGAVVWCPRDKTYGYRIGWRKLDELFREHGSERKP